MVTVFQNGSHFSITIDASNMGSQKIYPVVVQYFHITKRIQNKLLDFYEDPDETSLNIFENIEKLMHRLNLDPELLSGVSADNASVNYGIHNSVFQKFLEKHPETKIIKANCNCHVIHNAARITMKKLT